MDEEKTYYEILEVPENATPDDIKQTYRELVKKWHPDLHPGDDTAVDMMQSINEAYDVLSDPEERDKYDTKIRLSRPFTKRKNDSNPDDDEFYENYAKREDQSHVPYGNRTYGNYGSDQTGVPYGERRYDSYRRDPHYHKQRERERRNQYTHSYTRATYKGEGYWQSATGRHNDTGDFAGEQNANSNTTSAEQEAFNEAFKATFGEETYAAYQRSTSSPLYSSGTQDVAADIKGASKVNLVLGILSPIAVLMFPPYLILLLVLKINFKDDPFLRLVRPILGIFTVIGILRMVVLILGLVMS